MNVSQTFHQWMSDQLIIVSCSMRELDWFWLIDWLIVKQALGLVLYCTRLVHVWISEHRSRRLNFGNGPTLVFSSWLIVFISHAKWYRYVEVSMHVPCVDFFLFLTKYLGERSRIDRGINHNGGRVSPYLFTSKSYRLQYQGGVRFRLYFFVGYTYLLVLYSTVVLQYYFGYKYCT